jgi:hypothetical protein
MDRELSDIGWTGIDGGREGLWRSPIWGDVLRIIANNEGQQVYCRSSSIYAKLESEFPNETWRSTTKEGQFRPLFRDYSHPWTRTTTVSLKDQLFHVLPLGHDYLNGLVSKIDVLKRMFVNHIEEVEEGVTERPFCILAAAFASTQQLLSIEDLYWGVMRCFRPGKQTLEESLNISRRMNINKPIDPTRKRRLRSMLVLLRAADAISSHRLGNAYFWRSANTQFLESLTERHS